LTAADVAEIMRLLEDSSFDELTLEVDGLKLSLKRGMGSGGVVTRAETEASTPAAPVESSPAQAAPETPAKTAAADPKLHEVTSPLLGTFYRAPRPGAAPFVDVGASVEEDTVICIIEVMKLMNTVRAGVRGKVTEILVADGTLVEYGQALIRVRKDG
jgi:acetyl-CoA carboxylase biotin carboxyl carrier protein